MMKSESKHTRYVEGSLIFLFPPFFVFFFLAVYGITDAAWRVRIRVQGCCCCCCGAAVGRTRLLGGAQQLQWRPQLPLGVTRRSTGLPFLALTLSAAKATLSQDAHRVDAAPRTR